MTFHFINPISAAVKAAGEQNAYAATINGLYPKQREYVMCPDPVVANHMARRTGKSAGNVRRLIRRAPRHPGGLSFFGAKDIKTCKRIIGPTVREVSHEYDLGFEWSSQDSAFIAPNGYQIWLIGLSEDGEADKLRGAAHGLVEGVIDECATIRDDVLRYAVVECALPALGENEGRLALSGTPGPLLSGFFYDECQRRRCFTGDARDNPFLRIPGERYLANALKNNPGWTWQTPQFQREYLGIWCEDKDALIYPYLAARNLIYEGSEFQEGRTILGVDVGFEDGMGYTITRSQPPNNPEIHVLRSYEKRGQKFPGIAAEIESLRRHYNVNYIFIDEGNNGLLVSKSLQEAGIPCRPTPKGLKRPRIEVIRGALASGAMKVLRRGCETLIGEFGMLVWNEKRTDADERYSNECTDSLIYSALCHRGLYEALLEEPVHGSAKQMLNAQATDKEREERESIDASDVAKMAAWVNRTRGAVDKMKRPEPGMMGGPRVRR
jgi:hypothetical protein